MKNVWEMLFLSFVALVLAGCARPDATSSMLSVESRQALELSLAELQAELQKNAPFILEKLSGPASDEQIAQLRVELDGAEVQCLEVWYRWHNGCDDPLTRILPLGRMLSIAESTEDRRAIQSIPFVDTKRKQAIKLLDDGAGDGFFLDVSSAAPRVFYHMLEDPWPRDYGPLDSFVEFLTQVHRSGLATVNENGMVDFDWERYDAIQSDYLSKVGSL
jgi:hypothetical protein